MNRKHKGQLVCQHLENISREVLEKYQGIIRSYVKGRHGVYALYRKGKLYYVGLASNLRSRLKHHLTDRHAQNWDRFSLYFTLSGDHLKDLESLLIRVAHPAGNKQGGNFIRSDDLKRKFRKQISEYQRHELRGFFNEEQKETRGNVTQSEGREPTLAKYLIKRIHLRFVYKGKLYIAHVRRDGTISFAADSAEAKRLQGKEYGSPSMAAAAITKRTMNGWSSWKYERSPGEWVFLDELRK